MFSLILLSGLAYACYVDLDQLVIPDLVSIGLFPVGGFWWIWSSPEILIANLLGGTFAFILIYLFSLAFTILRKKEGLGFGDMKLIASATVWIGLPNLPILILIAASSGLIANFCNFGKREYAVKVECIPFGPHLSIATLLIWFSVNLNVPVTQFLRLF